MDCFVSRLLLVSVCPWCCVPCAACRASQLYVDLLESKAEKKLDKEINRSLNSNYRRLDNFIHNVKHK